MMQPRRRLIPLTLAVATAILSIGDRGLHGLAGIHHGGSFADEASGATPDVAASHVDCQLCAFTAEWKAVDASPAPSALSPSARSVISSPTPRPPRRRPSLAAARGPPASA